jgi:DNA polymerase III subunit delta'
MWQTAGQEKIINYLQNSISNDSVGHAYLFVGPSQVGKMTLALDFARALSCSSQNAPCGTCRTCQRIEESKYPDVVIINKNAGRESKNRKKNTEISIDLVREFLQKSSSLHPYEGKYKIFIIDDCDLMSSEAANCLLKTLEEPPPHVIIILLTSEEMRLLPTVVSRCQRFELKPIPLKETETILLCINDISEEKIRLLSRLSKGCLGWAISATTDNRFMDIRSIRLNEFSALLTTNWDQRLAYIQQISLDRNTAEELFMLWLSYCRDVMLIKYNCLEGISNIDRMNDLKSWANMLTVLEIKELIDSLSHAIAVNSSNANMHLLLEVIMLDIPKKERRAEFVTGSAVSFS